MSKLTDIQYRIDQLDGGAFQNLCDAYLTCKGYGIGYSLGMRTGTNKTAKGNASSQPVMAVPRPPPSLTPSEAQEYIVPSTRLCFVSKCTLSKRR